MNKINDRANRYNELVKRFADKNCKILTTCNEYIKNDEQFKKINIIASCGHEVKNVYVHMFLNRKSGTRCKECVKKETKRILKSKEIQTIDIEYLGVDILKKELVNYDTMKTVEGCLVDFIIKPKNITTDLYLPLQIKTTLNKNFNCYSFSGLTKDKYKNMLTLLICINDKMCWILKNDDINTTFKVNIGNKSKKYDKFKIDINKLNDTLIKLYNENKDWLNTKSFFNMPINIYQQREQEYIKLRETKLDFINFVKPLIDCQVYDFLIDNMKFQEKVCGIRKDTNQYICQLVKKYDSNNNKLKHINYELGDNDFYWINIPDKNTFYIFPEKILYDMNKINTGKIINLNIPQDNINHWTYKYKFYYDKPNKNEILKIINNRIEKKDIITDNNKLIEKLSKHIPDVIIKEEKQPQLKSCVDCQTNIFLTSTRCNECNNKYKLKVAINTTNRPSLQQLQQDLKDLRYYVKVAEKYNVSDNTIRKWINKHKNMKT